MGCVEIGNSDGGKGLLGKIGIEKKWRFSYFCDWCDDE